MNSYCSEIFNYLNTIEIIDTHEHLNPMDVPVGNRNGDFINEYLIHYFNRDLISSGLKRDELNRALNIELPLKERYKILQPYWNLCRKTGYGQSLDITVKGLYDVEEINESTISKVDEGFRKMTKQDRYEEILKKKCKIKTSLVNHPDAENCDRRFFTPVYHIDKLIWFKTGVDFLTIEEEAKMSIRNFNDYLEACEKIIDNEYKKDNAAFKCGLAYDRILKFERTTRDEAEKSFNQIFQSNYYIDKSTQVYSLNKAFQDYMMHFILSLINKKGMTVQFHTGLQEGNGNIIYNSNPELLSNLFLEYSNVNFDIFHIGYPYYNVLSALAKSFPNVYIDMCWAHIISPIASINALVEWLEVVPLNKISAFGGDYSFVDGVYGHQYIAKMNVAKALTLKIKEGLFDIEEAKDIAKLLFYDNPMALFRIKK